MPSRAHQGHPSDPVFSDTPTFEKKGPYSYGDPKRTDVLSAVDWLGNRFSVGDAVMYCIGAGRGQMMAVGKIRALRAGSRRVLVSWDWETDGEGEGYITRRRVNEVWEDTWDVEVQVLTERTSGAWDNAKRSRPAWVNPMNITGLAGIFRVEP